MSIQGFCQQVYHWWTRVNWLTDNFVLNGSFLAIGHDCLRTCDFAGSTSRTRSKFKVKLSIFL